MRGDDGRMAKTVYINDYYWDHPVIKSIAARDTKRRKDPFKLIYVLHDLKICYVEGDMECLDPAVGDRSVIYVEL